MAKGVAKASCGVTETRHFERATPRPHTRATPSGSAAARPAVRRRRLVVRMHANCAVAWPRSCARDYGCAHVCKLKWRSAHRRTTIFNWNGWPLFAHPFDRRVFEAQTWHLKLRIAARHQHLFLHLQAMIRGHLQSEVRLSILNNFCARMYVCLSVCMQHACMAAIVYDSITVTRISTGIRAQRRPAARSSGNPAPGPVLPSCAR